MSHSFLGCNKPQVTTLTTHSLSRQHASQVAGAIWLQALSHSTSLKPSAAYHSDSLQFYSEFIDTSCCKTFWSCLERMQMHGLVQFMPERTVIIFLANKTIGNLTSHKCLKPKLLFTVKVLLELLHILCFATTKQACLRISYVVWLVRILSCTGGQKKGGQKSAAAKSQPKQAGQKRKSSTDQPETADTEADEEAGTQKDSQKPSQPKYGTVKAGEVAGIQIGLIYTCEIFWTILYRHIIHLSFKLARNFKSSSRHHCL